MPDPGDYFHEDHLLAWLDSVDGDVFFMEFRRTTRGQARTDEQVRASMLTLVRLGLAEYTVNQRTGRGEDPWKAQITGEGVAVLRSHSGRIGFWYMSSLRQGAGAATNNYYNTTNVEGDVNDSQLATSGGDTIQTRAGGTVERTPSQAEAMLRVLFARSHSVVRRLDESTELQELKDEIEDAEMMVVALIQGAAPHPDDRLDAVEAIQRRLTRIARRIRDTIRGDDNTEAALLARDLGEQFIR